MLAYQLSLRVKLANYSLRFHNCYADITTQLGGLWRVSKFFVSKWFFQECERMIRKILLVTALVIVGTLFVGCHTIQGVGHDITAIGQAVEGVVQKRPVRFTH